MYDNTPLVMVEDKAGLERMIHQLEQRSVIGIDTESDSSYAYQEKVCLIQISDADTDFIIDPLKIDDLSPLGPILANPAITKVLHGADYDIVCLKRDFGFTFRGIFDTLIAAQLLGMERIGLADLIERYFGVELDKQYQRHNWALRPLYPEHLDYARGDTHWMPALRELVLRQLKRARRTRHMREECAYLERREWGGRTQDPDAWLDMKGIEKLDDEQKRVLKHLYLYREDQGERMNRPVYKVIPNEVLIELAEAMPTRMEDLDELFRTKHAMKRRHGSALIKAIVQGLDDDAAIPKRKRAHRERQGPKSRLNGRQADKVFADLKDWRARLLANRADLTAYMVASNSVLKAIASVRPTSLDELRRIPDVRRWQVRDWGREILAVLDRSAPL